LNALINLAESKTAVVFPVSVSSPSPIEGNGKRIGSWAPRRSRRNERNFHARIFRGARFTGVLTAINIRAAAPSVLNVSCSDGVYVQASRWSQGNEPNARDKQEKDCRPDDQHHAIDAPDGLARTQLDSFGATFPVSPAGSGAALAVADDAG
jgi:hypothetical protein